MTFLQEAVWSSVECRLVPDMINNLTFNRVKEGADSSIFNGRRRCRLVTRKIGRSQNSVLESLEK